MIDDRYEIVSEPLMGGMAIVYLCLDHSENKPVALKTFKPEYLPDRNARYRFIQEGGIWMQLGKHPNIVQCYRLEMMDETDGLFIVLELVPKEEGFPDASFRSWLVPGKPLPLRQALLFSIQIVRGMKYAVTKIPGLVHRDLKPENLLVGVDTQLEGKINHLHITDFGLSALLNNPQKEQTIVSPLKDQFSIDSMQHHTMPISGIIGTPLYMAPEQWNRQEIGIPTDIFAFGCIFYEMLAGKTYITGLNIEQIKANCCKKRLNDLSNVIPKEVKTIVDQSLELNPNKRFSNWESLDESINYAYERIFGQKIPKENKSWNAERDDLIQREQSYITLGNAFLEIGKIKEGQSYFERAITSGKANKHGDIEIMGILGLGGIFSHSGKYGQAIENYNKALSIAHENETKLEEAFILRRMGRVYTTIGDYKNAIKYTQLALDLSDESAGAVEDLADLIDLGTLKKYTGDISGANECFEYSLNIAKSIRNKSGEAKAMTALGIVYKNQGDLDRALQLHEGALKISLEIGDRITELVALVNLGVTYKNLGEMEKAIQIYQTALPISREVEDPKSEVAILYNLGIVYFNNRDYKSAHFYVKKALSISRSIGIKQKLISLKILVIFTFFLVIYTTLKCHIKKLFKSDKN